MITNREFINTIVAEGFLTRADSERLLSKYQGNAFAILEYLLKEHTEQKNELGKLWGNSIGAAYVDLDKTLVQQNIIKKLPERFAREHKMVPLYQFGDTITIAAADPTNKFILKVAGSMMESPVSPVFSCPEDIEYAIEINYQSGDTLNELLNTISGNPLFKETSRITEEQIKKLSGDRAVIGFTRGLMLLAAKERASDIHIEPGEDMVRIRFRIDGVLYERLQLDIALLPPLVSRLKVLSSLDITERRRPQDGRITLALANRSIDFRLSSIPTIYGEKVVLRLLGQIQSKEVPSLSELSFSRPLLDELSRVIESPSGVFFVTGPTGSGKTTTLYSVLKHLNKPGINIMTVEDPVEYRLKGINQIQVNSAINLDFATALRSFLRQDPDVILVGEIRDMETAKIAAQAALTGHLVLATMHTNNAPNAITRLVEIGVEPFLVAPSIIGIIAQRLVRKLCDHCKERYKLTPDEINDLFIWDNKTKVFFFRNKGCEECNYTGYSGRIAIQELLLMTDDLRRMVARDASIMEIQEGARKAGFKSMRYDGIKKVLRGLTTMEEIDRVTIADEAI